MPRKTAKQHQKVESMCFTEEKAILSKLGFCIEQINVLPVNINGVIYHEERIKILFYMPFDDKFKVYKTQLYFENIDKCMEFFRYFTVNDKKNIQATYWHDYCPQSFKELFPNQDIREHAPLGAWLI